MFQSENEMIVDDALSRINAIFNTAPLSQAEKPAEPLDASVRLENVTFSYDGMNNALENVSLTCLLYTSRCVKETAFFIQVIKTDTSIYKYIYICLLYIYNCA